MRVNLRYLTDQEQLDAIIGDGSGTLQELYLINENLALAFVKPQPSNLPPSRRSNFVWAAYTTGGHYRLKM